jgi:hypothetical protein
MVLLYVLVLLLLGGATLLVQRRARKLEKRYTRAAAQADKLLRKTVTKGGNTSRPDPYRAAKEHLELGLLVQKRDAIEERYTAWQGRADRLSHLKLRLRFWKGRALPYVMGAFDVAAVLVAAHYATAGQLVNLDGLFQAVQTLLN